MHVHIPTCTCTYMYIKLLLFIRQHEFRVWDKADGQMTAQTNPILRLNGAATIRFHPRLFPIT